ncbi:MAG: GNAT family N-acetyltransferase, partial [Pseudomonadota bacterium]
MMNYNHEIKIIPATITDYLSIQNMARFYVYDISRYCGFISKDWAIGKDGLYECFDLKKYFEDADKKAYLLRLKDGELVGFVLLDKHSTSNNIDWNMGEFFILAKFQGKGVASEVAKKIWIMHPGKWEVSVIPENLPALAFWRKNISYLTNNNYLEEIKTIDYDKDQPKRVIFEFNTMEDFIAINDIGVLNIPILENNDPLVDLREQNIIAFGPSPEIPNNTDYTYLRKTVYDKLVEAQNMLPNDLKFCIYEGYRSLGLQAKLFNDRYQKIKNLYPELNYQDLFV